MGSNGETSVDEEDTAVGPGGEETAIIWGRGEAWVVFFEGFEDVFEGGRSRRWGADGET